MNLAKDIDTAGKPQWQFTDYQIPDWEQGLLDATVRYLLSMIENDPNGDRHIRAIEAAFWDFHRHCALFSFYPRQSDRFWHYCA